MGFGDFLKKAADIGVEVGKGMVAKAAELKALKEELQSESNEKLKRLVKNGTRNEKIVAYSILKDRGLVS